MDELERATRSGGVFRSVRQMASLVGIGFVAGIIVGIVFSVLIKTILIVAAIVIVVVALARGALGRRT